MKLRIADLDIEVPYELLEDAQNHIADYCALDNSVPDITIHEDICELGEQLPLFDRMIVHGVAIAVKDERLKINDKASGFIFTAPSGTGKSTHAFLWQKLLGEDRVEVVNGDKPVVQLTMNNEQLTIFVWGTPWCGKEGLNKNVGVPLKGIVLLHRLYNEDENENRKPWIERATKEEWGDFMLSQTFLPRNPEALKRTFEMLELLYNNVPVYNLHADMSREAVELSVSTITNGKL